MLIDDWNKQFHETEDLQNFFTKKELELFPGKSNSGSLAGRYLIKGLIFSYLELEYDFKQIEILNDELGKPLLGLSNQLKESCQNRGIQSICCSISHSRKRVVGMIVIER
jgi:holo-[acyl-carrier protein] synthase